jgi:endo-1,4-beta-mannosidase
MWPRFARRAEATSTASQKRASMERFLLGINYWPRTSAMAMWSRFDLGEIDEDFARIAGLGLDVVRFFLTWSTFQPTADDLDETALANFVRVLDCAHKRGLRTMPTLFCGHMSGVNWLPEWTLDRRTPNGRFRTIVANGRELPYGIDDFYTGELLTAQRRFARAAGYRACDHAALLAWDLGNEFSNLREPRSPRDAAHWSASLTHDLLESSHAGSTGGLHGEDLERDRNIRPSSIARPWGFATMHGYPVYSDFARARTDAEVVPFLCELAASCAQKPVLFSEFGNPTCPPQAPGTSTFACLSEDEMTLYARAVLERLQARGALGAFWWCWADYASDLAATPPFDRAPHELTFGLIRADGTEKPVAQTLGAFARERRPALAPQTPIVTERAYYAGLPAAIRTDFNAYVRAREGAGEPA